MLHYTSSYMGLCDLLYWGQMLEALDSAPPGTPEEEITHVANAVIRLSRAKQVYSIDDEYYYEPRRYLYDDARAAKGDWSIGACVGNLFRVDGTMSEKRFWGTRFFLGDGAVTTDLSSSFLRIPLGVWTALEHMAKAIDFLGEIRQRDPNKVSAEFGEQAGEPDLLRYYCLTHWVGPQLQKIYGQTGRKYSYFVSGQLVALLSEIPFHDADTWSALARRAGRHLPLGQEASLLHPHPSFIFPVLLEAAFDSNIQWNNYDIGGMEGRADRLLEYIGLPPLIELRQHRDQLFDSVREVLGRSTLGQELLPLIDELNHYAGTLSWSNRLANPMKGMQHSLPGPVLFDDGSCLDGSLLSFVTCDALAQAEHRCKEFCRFPVVRDIVDN